MTVDFSPEDGGREIRDAINRLVKALEAMSLEEVCALRDAEAAHPGRWRVEAFFQSVIARKRHVGWLESVAGESALRIRSPRVH